MQRIKTERLQYYCSAVGEIHECGKRMLSDVKELPPSLQQPYLDLWTCYWNLCCYIVFLDNQPGILLVAEYDDEYCETHGIPTEYEEQRRILYKYGERLEALAQSINPHAIIGLDDEAEYNTALIMFIPTEIVPLQDIPKLYYLMDQYGFQRPPSAVHWTERELSEFIKHLEFPSSVEKKMLDTLHGDVVLHTDGDPAESLFSYMGMEIQRERLYGRDEVLEMMRKNGGGDRGLHDIGLTYESRFGNQLIWQYPFSDDMKGGGAIVPVQEGFLFLPYSIVMEGCGVRYQLDNAEMLTAAALQTLKTECKAYADGLLAALGDMETAARSRPARQYIDAHGNLYFVRAVAAGRYTGFRRYASSTQGRNQESSMSEVSFADDFEQAQLELDLYAKKHRLRQLEDSELQKKDGEHG